MNKIYTVITLLCISFSLLANEIHYSSNATLYEHLVSINKEWKTQDHQLDHLLLQQTSFESDEDRIQLHLKLVETILRNRTTDHLPVAIRNKRLENLKSLISYWQHGQFPKNTNHLHRQPYFIDTYGTACAVGHLLQTSGEAALAKRISLEQNYAFIRELQYPELNAWASENGFETSELAWIQPAYNGCYKPVNNPYSSAFNQVYDMKEIDGLLYIAGNIGFFDPNMGIVRGVAIYDGTNFTGINLIILGAVYDIVEDPASNDIYFVGDMRDSLLQERDVFKYNSQTGVAGWLVNSPITGTIRKGAFYDCSLYVGGDFSEIDGLQIDNFAAYSGGVWTDTPTNCAGIVSTTKLPLNGKINDMLVMNNTLIIGGDFTNAPDGSVAPGLAFYSNSVWSVPSGASSVLSSVDFLKPTYNYNPNSNPLNLIIAGDSLMVYHWTSKVFVTKGCMDIKIPENVGRVDGLISDNNGIGLNAAYIKGNQVRTLASQNYYNYTYGFGFQMHFSSTLNCLIDYQGRTFLGGKYSYLKIGEWHKGTSGGCPYYYNFIQQCSSSPESGGLFEYEMAYLPFPVELASFEANATESDQVELTWQTHAEENSSHYEIERSRTGEENSFKKIGEVKAAGNSNQVINYNYTDRLSVQSNYFYYRLNMVDLDGSSEYSNIEVVKFEQNDEQEIDLYPNPTNDEITIATYLSLSGPTQIQIYNLQGKLVKDIEYITTDKFITTDIDVNDLASGMYLLQISNEEDRIVTKFQKMN